MTDTKKAEKIAAKAAVEERKLVAVQAEFALNNKEFAKFLKDQAKAQAKISEMWEDVKSALIEAKYFDVMENENFRVSVSKVAGIKVTDVNELPDKFTETVKVAKTDKIKEHYNLYGKLPKGTKDNSYYRLNKKVK